MRKQVILALFATAVLAAQNPSDVEVPAGGVPIYNVNVVARTTKAINYNHRSGPTKIGFAGTVLLPEATGEAKVESKKGAVQIKAEFKNLEPPTRFGRQYLTYVLWAITPEDGPEIWARS
jgi:hypothetical protein